MSQLREVENGVKALLDAVAARTDAATGTAATGSATTLTDAALSGTDWQWAVLAMTSGANAGRWRVVTSWDDDTDTVTVRQAFPAAIAAEDTYSLAMAPLGGATVFLRNIIPKSLRAAELPAVFVAGQRTRRIEPQVVGNEQGARQAIVEIRTDLIAPWGDDEETDRELSDKLFEQVDQMRQMRTRLPGIARMRRSTRDEEISSFGELDAGQRVFWSIVWTPFDYGV